MGKKLVKRSCYITIVIWTVTEIGISYCYCRARSNGTVGTVRRTHAIVVLEQFPEEHNAFMQNDVDEGVYWPPPFWIQCAMVLGTVDRVCHDIIMYSMFITLCMLSRRDT